MAYRNISRVELRRHVNCESELTGSLLAAGTALNCIIWVCAGASGTNQIVFLLGGAGTPGVSVLWLAGSVRCRPPPLQRCPPLPAFLREGSRAVLREGSPSSFRGERFQQMSAQALMFVGARMCTYSCARACTKTLCRLAVASQKQNNKQLVTPAASSRHAPSNSLPW